MITDIVGAFQFLFFFFLIYWRLDRKQFVNRKLTWVHNRQTHVVTIYSLTIYILLCNITVLSPFLHNSLHFWNILQDLSPKFVSFSPLKFPRPTQIQSIFSCKLKHIVGTTSVNIYKKSGFASLLLNLVKIHPCWTQFLIAWNMLSWFKGWLQYFHTRRCILLMIYSALLYFKAIFSLKLADTCIMKFIKKLENRPKLSLTTDCLHKNYWQCSK